MPENQLCLAGDAVRSQAYASELRVCGPARRRRLLETATNARNCKTRNASAEKTRIPGIAARLSQVARMITDGTITARIRSTVEPNDAGQMIERLRNGGLSGKAVIGTRAAGGNRHEIAKRICNTG